MARARGGVGGGHRHAAEDGPGGVGQSSSRAASADSGGLGHRRGPAVRGSHPSDSEVGQDTGIGSAANAAGTRAAGEHHSPAASTAGSSTTATGTGTGTGTGSRLTHSAARTHASALTQADKSLKRRREEQMVVEKVSRARLLVDPSLIRLAASDDSDGSARAAPSSTAASRPLKATALPVAAVGLSASSRQGPASGPGLLLPAAAGGGGGGGGLARRPSSSLATDFLLLGTASSASGAGRSRGAAFGGASGASTGLVVVAPRLKPQSGALAGSSLTASVAPRRT